MGLRRAIALDLHLHPKQGEVLLSEANEILYGGAAGGGKSHLARVLFIQLCWGIPGFQAYLFRRRRGDLRKNHIEGPKGFRRMLAPFITSGLAEIVGDEIRFANGSKIFLCHCKNPDDVYNYWGAEMHALFIDEATQFTEKMVRFLRTRLRVPGLELPPGMEQWRKRLPLLLLSANPIGIGVAWVKAWFIDTTPEMVLRRMPKSEGGMLRQYIPAKLEDNPSMRADDPTYEDRLEGMGSPGVVRAMRHGDWSAIEGAYFTRFMETVISPFQIPEHWNRYTSFDWGSAKPFSVGWWAVSSGDGPGELAAYRPGEVIRYREWYGAERTDTGESVADSGLYLENVDIGRGILARETYVRDGKEYHENIIGRVADPSIFTKKGAKSIAEDLASVGVHFTPGVNDRIQGWKQMTARHKGYDGRPMSWVFDTCRDSIRTIPYLIHDVDGNPEDLDTDGEDHAADEHRYFYMFRPWHATVERAPGKPKSMDEITYDELFRREIEERELGRYHR